MTTSTSIGDLARTMSSRMQMTRLKAQLGTLSNELATGRKDNVSSAVRGEFSIVSSLEGSLKSLSAYSNAMKEGGLLLDSVQTALTTVHDIIVETGPTLILSSEISDATMLKAAGEDAAQHLSSVISALNLTVAGRAVFAGTSTEAPPLTHADAILDELMTVVAGAATPADAMTLIEDWFHTPGGGYETVAYSGGAAAGIDIPIAEGETLSHDVTALDSELRAMLVSFASAALVSKGMFDGNPEAQSELLNMAGQSMMTAEAGVSDVQAQVGAQQAFLEDAMLRNEASEAAYQMALNDIYAADPYETATQLEAVTLQLETLYAITARLSELSMTAYLR